jgi:HSP20 family protein
MDETFTGQRTSHEAIAPIDVYQTDDEVIVEVAIPGVDPDDMDVSIDGDTLTVRGEVREETESEQDPSRRYHIRERYYKSFTRSIRLPTLIDADNAKAEYKNGILKLSLPKAEEVKPKMITVKAK